MINADDRKKASDALLDAYESQSTIAPIVETFDNADIDDAYEIQRLQVTEWMSQGETVKGHKVGLTSPAMQNQLGVAQPDFGHLMSDMFHPENQPVATT